MSVLVLRALGFGRSSDRCARAAGDQDGLAESPAQAGAPAWLAPLVPLIGAVDELAVTSGNLGHPPLVSMPDVAVNLHGRGAVRAYEPAAVGPPKKSLHRGCGIR